MKNLNELLLEITTKNTVKTSQKRNVNEMLIEVLSEGKKLTRIELINEISILRYKDEFKVELNEKMLSDKEVVANFIKITKTIRNGVDTSISRSNNNSSFHYNPKYSNYELKQGLDGKFFMNIIKK